METESCGSAKLLTVLQERFAANQSKNPGFSLRAYAKKLGVPPTVLSELLRGKRPLTLKQAEKLCSRLQLDPSERTVLLRDIPNRRAAKTWTPQYSKNLNLIQVATDQFRVIADWQCFAILSLTQTKNFSSEPAWIADRLGIPIRDVRHAIERLLRLQLLIRKGKSLVQEKDGLKTTSDIPDSAIKKYHSESLRQAEHALHDIALEWREISSSVFACDTSRLPEAKQMLKRFRREVAAFLEGGPNPTEVYRLSVQLIPVSQNQKMKGNQ